MQVIGVEIPGLIGPPRTGRVLTGPPQDDSITG
jgi:hypothetical protein